MAASRDKYLFSATVNVQMLRFVSRLFHPDCVKCCEKQKNWAGLKIRRRLCFYDCWQSTAHFTIVNTTLALHKCNYHAAFLSRLFLFCIIKIRPIKLQLAVSPPLRSSSVTVPSACSAFQKNKPKTESFPFIVCMLIAQYSNNKHD